MSSNPLRIWFAKIDGLIKIYDGIRYLVIPGHVNMKEICDSIKHLISEKSGITNITIIILQESQLIHTILYLLKKC